MGHSKIIDRFGGAASLHKALERVGTRLHVQTIHTWTWNDRIPAQHHDAIFRAAEETGIPLHPADFFSEEWRHGTTAEKQRARATERRGGHRIGSGGDRQARPET